MLGSASKKTKLARSNTGFAKLVLAALIIVALAGASLAFLLLKNGDTRTLNIGDQRYILEVADSDEARSQGLSGRESMSQNKGMIFVYEQEAASCFWMKDMNFALDIIWLDSAHKVVHMEQGAAPESYPEKFCSPEAARYVIELNSGEAARANIAPGVVLDFD